MNIQHHMALLERAIAGAFVNNGLYVHLCGNIQGPHTLTFGLRLYEPTQRNINKALGLAGAVETAVADSPVRIYMDRGVILVETPSPLPTPIDGRHLRGQGLAAPLGMTSRQTVAGIDLATNPHLLLVGPTNRGKTTAARLLAYRLARQNPPREVRLIIATFKPADWRAFAGLAHTFAVITDPRETMQMIAYLVDVMHRRTQSGQDTPHLFVFLDDLLNLLGVAGADPQLADHLAQLASLGRGAGIHLIVGTQRLGEKGAAGGLVTGNMPTRLVFGTADAQDAALFTGRGGSGAERLGRYPGDALLITDGGVQRLAVGRISDAHLAELRQQPDSWRPWLTHTAHRADQPITTPVLPVTLPAVTAGAAVLPVAPVTGVIAADGPQPPPRSATGSGTPVKLPNQEPTAEAQCYLRRLYNELGSKNKVLLHAWGGVINATGKTPRSLRWLDEALAAGR